MTTSAVPAPSVVRVKVTSPETRWPAMASWMPVPSTRRYGPAGRSSCCTPPSRLRLWLTRIPVELSATPRVPLKLTASPGTTRATVPLIRPATPALVSARNAVPSVTRTPAVAVPRVRRTSVATSWTLTGGFVAAGAPGMTVPVTWERTNTPATVWPATVSSAGVAAVPIWTRTERGASATPPAVSVEAEVLSWRLTAPSRSIELSALKARVPSTASAVPDGLSTNSPAAAVTVARPPPRLRVSGEPPARALAPKATTRPVAVLANPMLPVSDCPPMITVRSPTTAVVPPATVTFVGARLGWAASVGVVFSVTAPVPAL